MNVLLKQRGCLGPGPGGGEGGEGGLRGPQPAGDGRGAGVQVPVGAAPHLMTGTAVSMSVTVASLSKGWGMLFFWLCIQCQSDHM